MVGVALGGIDMWLRDLVLIYHLQCPTKARSSNIAKKSASKKIEYPKPDGVYSFDRLSSVYLSSTNHEEDQPVHLNVSDFGLQTTSEYHDYGGPSANYCPAGVYEWILEGEI
ncbi:MAG: hypothetical protein CM15mP111_3180 [Hyphomicrobiales bacterium]|nr:MAG: hypothetical protein CM15mP111_3180 [Hyphomicrobiales bacterium]